MQRDERLSTLFETFPNGQPQLNRLLSSSYTSNWTLGTVITGEFVCAF